MKRMKTWMRAVRRRSACYQFTLYAYGVPDLQAAGGVPRTGTAALYSFVLNKGIGNQLLAKTSFIATFGR